ncbi:hypothetical protein L5515_002974 [Caenorhabditis briggsae]|uniref:Uncharacterized protein n=2 Tax=Caenorhabditis TaxID=6237 RepID=A0AAE9EHS5_CAEBR|nr:hypothetical protein B9Z55_008418 [Caenorhabditis nigoni]ULT98470.1 hypothetical protein L3Y34_000086 [Caenorhabditis briggsae]UMM21182.1 hypothetical protein L5515_002974 [Caenorhabditis briggsae]
MLGAQALRTKQKAERKEKEKRHRERLRSIEMQRNQMHRNACEDAAAQFMEITANPPLKVRSMSLSKSGDELLIVTTKHRHSVHSGTVPHLQVRMTHRNSSSNGSTDRFELEPVEPTSGGPQRSTSSDYCKVDKKNSISGTTRLLKWLGISDKQTSEPTEQPAKKPMSKRRMSTFT